MQRARAGIRAEPNVTPMIDVMLVLLIIFMTVVPILSVGFSAEPPVGAHLEARPDEPGDPVIGLDRMGNYYLNKQPVTEAALRARLEARFPLGEQDRVVYLRADKNLLYERVGDAMDLATAAGARVVGLVGEMPMSNSNEPNRLPAVTGTSTATRRGSKP